MSVDDVTEEARSIEPLNFDSDDDIDINEDSDCENKQRTGTGTHWLMIFQ